MPSAVAPFDLAHPAAAATPSASAGPVGYTPAQVRHAYGFDQIRFAGKPGDGSGTTIAIVDAYDNPNIASDLAAFDAYFGLQAPPSFTKVNQSGGSTLPAADAGWAQEIALDVEWAHAIAPAANILLVEANDKSATNLFSAVDYAARQPGVVVVSMSFVFGESPSETSVDGHLVTPAGHGGVVFVAASGDHGAPASYPAVSPYVLAVGGTSLPGLDAAGDYTGESGWSGSGGGVSVYETQPSYQKGVVTQSGASRTSPDVAYDADPDTGFAVYDSYNNGTAAPWSQVGGTSAGAPQWAALVAIADQGRAAAGKAALDGPTLLPAVYRLPASDFHDVTAGTSTGAPGQSTGPGYDLVTGRGSPVANRVVGDLVSLAAPAPATPPPSAPPAPDPAPVAFVLSPPAPWLGVGHRHHPRPGRRHPAHHHRARVAVVSAVVAAPAAAVTVSEVGPSGSPTSVVAPPQEGFGRAELAAAPAGRPGVSRKVWAAAVDAVFAAGARARRGEALDALGSALD
jgi:hypothetical protein